MSNEPKSSWTRMELQLLELLEGISQKDEAALEQLRERTQSLLASHIHRIVREPWTAEEALQDVYLFVWKRAGEYRPDRGTPLAWLFTVARSRALDSLRRGRKHSMASEYDEQVHPQASEEGAAQPAEIWWNALVRKGVRELPAAQERLIALAFYEGYSHSEIALATGLPLGTVKTRIRVALLRLRESLSPAPATPPKALPSAA